MQKEHHYKIFLNWTGNQGEGTCNYKSYSRNHTIEAVGKPVIDGSSDPSFRGDANRYNPEEMFLASLSACHMLWYLHLCAEAGVIVTAYTDDASGVMQETTEGGGRFISVTLYPNVVVKDGSMINDANALHHLANQKCFIANSCNFPVLHQPVCTAEQNVFRVD